MPLSPDLDPFFSRSPHLISLLNAHPDPDPDPPPLFRLSFSFASAVEHLLHGAGITTSVMIPNVQALVDQQMSEALAAQKSGLGFEFGAYHELEDVSG